MDYYLNKGVKYKRNSSYNLDSHWTSNKYAYVQVELVLYCGRLLNLWTIKSKFKNISSYDLDDHWTLHKYAQVQI